jgi:hypothetical protein
LCIEEAHDVIVPHCLRLGDQGAVARDLLMLGRLRRADDDGIEDFLVGNFAGKLIAFLDQAVDGRALDAFRLLAELIWFSA